MRRAPPVWLVESEVALGAALAGYLLGRPSLAAMLLVGCGLFVAWHVLHALRLRARLDGRAVGWLPGVWGSLAERSRADLDAARARADAADVRARRLIEALPDAAALVDADGRLLGANARASRLGVTWPDDRGAPLSLFERVPRQGAGDATDWDNALQVEALDTPGMRLAVRARALDDGSFLVMAHDVTARHRFDRMRQDFVANVSHELRTPLTVLRGFLESMRDAGDELGAWAPAVASMDAQSRRMQLLVEDLLTLSRVELGERAGLDEVNDIPALLEVLVSEARELGACDGHRITLQAEPGLGLRGAGNELRSAFANLVFNAVLHTPPGTPIHVEWGADDVGARMTVRDSGQGIAAENLPRLTERFYRVDPSRSRHSGGTGLGLAIVKHVLLRHDSRLEIRSRPGLGSTFSCRFPEGRVTHGRLS